MTKYKSIILDEITYNQLSKLAHENGRTRSGQIRIMLDAFDRMHIQSVGLLPHPPDGNAIPVIYVKESEKE